MMCKIVRMGLLGIFIGMIGFVAVFDAFAQTVELRHQFQPGQAANTITDVQMQGDSFLTGKKAATQLRMQMDRIMKVSSVDTLGNAKMDVSVQRIRTQGKMEDSSFNKDLTGADLQSTMFGANQMNVEVSPLGFVRGGEGLDLQKLGITLPSSMDDSGGFEFPTFPVEAVRVGDTWTENGQLLQRTNSVKSNLSGESVYKLSRIYNSPQGRIGVIHYKKTSDLSGLGLGGNMNLTGAGVGSAVSNPSTQVGGLVIQLEGEIEFNVDRGVVIKTTQQGYWNLDMNINMGAMDLASMGGNYPQAVAPNTSGQKTGLKQSMKMKISSQLQWTGEKKPIQQAKTPQWQFPQKRMLPVLPPATVQPPELPKVVPDKEIP